MGPSSRSICSYRTSLVPHNHGPMKTMKAIKAGKAMKAGSKVMTKGALVRTLAEQHEMKAKVCSGIFEGLGTLATTEVKKTGIFTIPGLCRIKTRVKPATMAGLRMAFGQEIKVKAKPASADLICPRWCVCVCVCLCVCVCV